MSSPSRVIAERKYGPYRDREGTRTFVTVELTELSDRTWRISFTGETYLKHSSRPDSCGQAQGSAPLALVALWNRWHLNDMRAGCKHQEARYRATPAERPTHTNGYMGTAGDTLSGLCSECGYRYGSAWLFEPLPVDILEQCDIAAKVVG